MNKVGGSPQNPVTIFFKGINIEERVEIDISKQGWQSYSSAAVHRAPDIYREAPDAIAASVPNVQILIKLSGSQCTDLQQGAFVPPAL